MPRCSVLLLVQSSQVIWIFWGRRVFLKGAAWVIRKKTVVAGVCGVYTEVARVL